MHFNSLKPIFICYLLTFLWISSQAVASDYSVKNESEPPEFADDWADDDFDTETDAQRPKSVWDPLEKVNRCLFVVNDKFYFWCLKPVAKTYIRITPSPVRLGIHNFFNNIRMPQRAINCILQARPKAFGTEVISFVMNTTVGFLGLCNPAEKYYKIKPHNEDLGQTLGSYGIGNGPYIVLPFLGSSTLRDMTGIFGDGFLDPINYLEDTYTRVAINGVEAINSTSFRLGQYESIKEAAFEPYSAVKDGYIQYRKKQISQ